MGSNEIIKQFIELFAIVDPVGGVVFFLSLTRNLSPSESRKTAATAPVVMAFTLAAAVLGGEKILWFFSISIHSFEVGGGILILLNAIAMLWGYAPYIKRTAEERLESEAMPSVAIVPLGIPLLSGPGAITTMIIGAHGVKGIADVAILIGIILAVSAITFFFFLKAHLISKLLGTTGMNSLSRLLGLLLAAISVEIISNGLKGLFPVLGRPF